ncbi:hypothetical protein KCU77_g3370, partial [Aureobasidium melanogenum]
MADRVFDLLALPENIRSLINIGTATSKRIRLIQHAPETSERLKSLGFDIYHAQLYLQLEELNLLLEQEDSVEYRILAAKHTKKLSDLTTEAEQTLNKCFDGAEVRKIQLGIFAEDIGEILKRYGRALSDFQAFMSALYIQQQLKLSKDSEKLLLERDRFAVYRRYETATKFYLDHNGPDVEKITLQGQQGGESRDESKRECKTYSSRDSHVVTHRSTNLPFNCLCMAERTGMPSFQLTVAVCA